MKYIEIHNEGKFKPSAHFTGTLDDIIHNLQVTGMMPWDLSMKFKKPSIGGIEPFYQLITKTHRFRTLPGSNHNFKYAVYKDEGFITITIIDSAKKDIAGTLLLSKQVIPQVGSVYHVDSVAVNPEFRGQNIGYALYGVAVMLLKLKIRSGKEQTPDGVRMWNKMAQIPGVTSTVVQKTKTGYTQSPIDVENGQITNYPTGSNDFIVLSLR